jgi:hypothetical protein
MQVLLIISKKMRHACRYTSETTLPFSRSRRVQEKAWEEIDKINIEI